MINRIISFGKYGLIGLAAILLIYLLTAAILSIMPASPAEKITCDQDQMVYVASNGVHLDFIIPKEHLSDSFIQELRLPSAISHIAVGWGDREFYIETPTWDDLNLVTAFKALFINTESAVHVVGIERVHQHWSQVPLCQHQMASLMEYVDQTFSRNPDGSLIEIEAAGYGSRDRFFEARGSFSGIQTCNNWVNQGLKSANVTTSIWSPFDKGVLYQVRKSAQ